MTQNVDTPLISVIVPVYNVAQYLTDTLESLLAQTYRNWEAICVDDGSTDNSADILLAYATKDSRVRYYRQDNAGPYAARNHGLRYIQGDYFTFLDGDDLYFPWTLEYRLTALRQSGADIVEDVPFLFEDGAVLSGIPSDNCCPYVSKPFRIDDVSAILRGQSPWWNSVWCKLYSKRFSGVRVAKVSKVSYGEDTNFNLLCLAYGGRMAFVTSFGVAWRQRSASISHASEKFLVYNTDWLLSLLPLIEFLPVKARDVGRDIADWVVAQRAEGFLSWTKPKYASGGQRRELCWAFWRYFLAGGLRLRHLSFVDRFCFRLFALTGWRRPLRWMKFKPGLTAWRENQLCIGETEPLA